MRELLGEQLLATHGTIIGNLQAETVIRLTWDPRKQDAKAA